MHIDAYTVYNSVMAVTTDVSAALLLCRAECSVFFFCFPLPHCLHCSREFSGAVVAGVVEQLRVCMAHLLFSTTLSRVFTTPRNSRVAYIYKAAYFAVRSLALRRTIADGVKHKHPLQAFLRPNCLMLLHIYVFFKQGR